MKLLLDQNLSVDLVDVLQDLYPGVAHVKTLGMIHSLDRTLWRWAKAHGYAICSRDSDFYHWAMLTTLPKFIWVRVGNCSFDDAKKLFRQNHSLIQAFLNEPQQGILMLTRHHLV